MIEITEQQRQELWAPEPVAIDPQTKAKYVLVRQQVYERLKALIAMEESDPDEGAAYINEIMAEDDAKDPYLESYQHFGKNPRSGETSSSCLFHSRTNSGRRSGPWSWCNRTRKRRPGNCNRSFGGRN